MIVVLLIWFMAIIAVAIAAGITSGIKRSSSHSRGSIKPTPPKKSPGFDSLDLPLDMPFEQKQEIVKIANFYDIRYVTQADVQKYSIHKISEQFNSMSGWDIWDVSIHETHGQYDRLERSLKDEIKVLSYDPEYRLAKVRGKTSIYLTSCKRCSCPDYRERRLPCKHMYALAIELDGDVDKRISSQSKPLSGLTFALAGHFSGGREGSDGIRSKITRLGGVWADNVSRSCSALITGTSPSVSKLDKAAYFDMEVIPVEVIDDLFAVEPNAGDKVVASNPPTAETRRIANPDNKKFADKTFVFTGELEQITRIEAMDMVERCGGKVSGSVSGKTNYVVAGSAPGSKIERAHELGIAVISEQEFLEMLPHT